MLSFLKENGLDQPNENGNDPSQTNELQNQTDDEFLTVSAHPNRVRKSTLSLGIVFAIGIVCLVFMIVKSKPNAASASTDNTQQEQIEQTLRNITNVKTDIFSGLERIVRKFYDYSDVEQVGVEELSKNPFRLEHRFVAGMDEEKEKKPKIDLKQFHLVTIMAGENACCMINDKFLRVGDSIEGFKVTEITNKNVTLTNEYSEIILKLEE